ncbi:hypothetical protein D9753_00560 [Streptomyces dangxiongensis]|uniref:Uncharacterized protein n=1 Tax=Streptomyces dangxiongensis TaxID=1442032 RepID=A0A3G2J6A8_9ACTN|nr:hypothetical protein D9753_00560 [Streptomyces dangxiongensis]
MMLDPDRLVLTIALLRIVGCCTDALAQVLILRARADLARARQGAHPEATPAPVLRAQTERHERA